eukprot:309209-Pyramimonas_sp.AAC.2
MRSPTQHSASWPHREPRLQPQWLRSHAPPPEQHSASRPYKVPRLMPQRRRSHAPPPSPAQRRASPPNRGAQPKAPVAAFTCVSTARAAFRCPYQAPPGAP